MDNEGPKWNFQMSGAWFGESYHLKCLVSSREAQSCISDVLSLIRSNLKYVGDLSDREVATLERIRELLYPGYIDGE